MKPGEHQQEEFYESLDGFRSSLQEAQQAIAGSVTLNAYPTTGEHVVDLTAVNTPEEVARIVEDKPKGVEMLEGVARIWCEQLQKIIIENEQLRQEPDNIGPRAELEWWKQVMAKFDGVLGQIKRPDCVKVVTILYRAKSKVLTEWKRLDEMVTLALNEAKDNVKYLTALDKFCGPLYRSNPADMKESVPGLMNAIRMIHSISGYYNTSERMTALCVKVG